MRVCYILIILKFVMYVWKVKFFKAKLEYLMHIAKDLGIT